MIVESDSDILTLMTRLKPVAHKAFQESIKESRVLASQCFVMELGAEKTVLSRNQSQFGVLLYEIATTFLAKYRKHLTPPVGGQYTLFDKFVNGPSRSVMETFFVKENEAVSSSCFANGKQVTFYVSLKSSHAGQALCVRAILNTTDDGRPSNKGTMLLRTVISG